MQVFIIVNHDDKLNLHKFSTSVKKMQLSTSITDI